MAKNLFSLKPVFFDLFGLPVFAFLTWVGYSLLYKPSFTLTSTMAKIILFIGVLGIIIDGRNVYQTYIKGR